MRTPWGDLKNLDLSDANLALKILCDEKHQLVEGMIVECLFDQILESLSAHTPSVVSLNVETVIAHPRKYHDKKIAIVWAREKVVGLGRYLVALEKMFQVFVVEYHPEKEFYGYRREGGKRSGEVMAIDDLLAPVAAQEFKEFRVLSSVRDDQRLKDAIWGFLFPYHGKRLAERVLLPRLLMNCGIQPWFKYAWNVDRIFLVDDRLWLFEIKHKFPYVDHNTKSLMLGLNNGEATNFRLLADCGISTLFSIMVKPKWSKKVGSLYMITDLKARENTAVIGKVLDSARLKRLLETSSGTSRADTTITGDINASLNYRGVPAQEFALFGRFSNRPSDLAEKMVEEMRGVASPKVLDEELKSLKMSF